jgi:signal transduction histidine kinase/CheY-like chemotaxis protein
MDDFSSNATGGISLEQRFRTLSRAFEEISEAVLILDENRRIAGLNGSARSLLDVREKDVMHGHLEEVARFKHAAESKRFEEAFESRERLELNADLLLCGGRELSCSVSLSNIVEDGERRAGFMMLLKDRMAQVRMERRLIQLEKMSSLGSLVAGFAHELNNPLTSVISYAQLLKSSRKDESLREEMGVIHSHAVRCKKIVDNLLAFAREHAPEKKLIDVNSVIRSTFDLFRYQLERRRTRVLLNLDGTLPMIRAEESQVQQVLVNLIVNARYEFTRMRQPGTITVTTEHGRDRVVIRVADSGGGVPGEIIDKIFDPFFTTKPAGKGTGLGLSLTRGIVQEHGGSVTARNPDSGGTEFMIELPLCAEAAQNDSNRSDPDLTEKEIRFEKGKRLLVVDGEKDICGLVTTYFKGKGMIVDAASSAREALAKLESSDFDLLLLDIRLPDGDGVEIKNLITRRWPAYRKRILFITGEAVEEMESDLRPFSVEDNPVITKPFNIHFLATRISEALAAHAVPLGESS